MFEVSNILLFYIFEWSLLCSPRLHLFDQIYSKITASIWNKTFCNIIHVFAVIFYPFNASLLNKAIISFFKKYLNDFWSNDW